MLLKKRWSRENRADVFSWLRGWQEKRKILLKKRGIFLFFRVFLFFFKILRGKTYQLINYEICLVIYLKNVYSVLKQFWEKVFSDGNGLEWIDCEVYSLNDVDTHPRLIFVECQQKKKTESNSRGKKKLSSLLLLSWNRIARSYFGEEVRCIIHDDVIIETRIVRTCFEEEVDSVFYRTSAREHVRVLVSVHVCVLPSSWSWVMAKTLNTVSSKSNCRESNEKGERGREKRLLMAVCSKRWRHTCYLWEWTVP